MEPRLGDHGAKEVFDLGSEFDLTPDSGHFSARTRAVPQRHAGGGKPRQGETA